MKFTEQQIITAMKGTGGIYQQILNNLSKLTDGSPEAMFTRQALRYRIEGNEDLTEAYLAEQEVIGDVAETQLVKNMQSGNMQAVGLWIRFKGYARGYKTVSDHDITTGGQPINTVVDTAVAADFAEFLRQRTQKP